MYALSVETRVISTIFSPDDQHWHYQYIIMISSRHVKSLTDLSKEDLMHIVHVPLIIIKNLCVTGLFLSTIVNMSWLHHVKLFLDTFQMIILSWPDQPITYLCTHYTIHLLLNQSTGLFQKWRWSLVNCTQRNLTTKVVAQNQIDTT